MNRATVVTHPHRRSKSTLTERLHQLLAELQAINAWDLAFLHRNANDGIDRAAWATRRTRLREIRLELETLLSSFDILKTHSRN
jgi:hypothetical protein